MQQLAALIVILGVASSIVIYADTRRTSQPMKIMNLVWAITGLWAGLLGLWAYVKIGRMKTANKKSSMEGMPDVDMDNSPKPSMPTPPTPSTITKDPKTPMAKMVMNMGVQRPLWQSVALSTLHCGAGCAMADIVGELFVHFVPITIAGSLVAGTWTLEYILALTFGLGFQYFAISSMTKLPFAEIIIKALKSDILSLTAWQIGMYGWMALSQFVIFGHDNTTMTITNWSFWFMMQVAMVAGFITAYPVNIWLLKAGIKKPM